MTIFVLKVQSFCKAFKAKEGIGHGKDYNLQPYKLGYSYTYVLFIESDLIISFPKFRAIRTSKDSPMLASAAPKVRIIINVKVRKDLISRPAMIQEVRAPASKNRSSISRWWRWEVKYAETIKIIIDVTRGGLIVIQKIWKPESLVSKTSVLDKLFSGHLVRLHLTLERRMCLFTP